MFEAARSGLQSAWNSKYANCRTSRCLWCIRFYDSGISRSILTASGAASPSPLWACLRRAKPRSILHPLSPNAAAGPNVGHEEVRLSTREFRVVTGSRPLSHCDAREDSHDGWSFDEAHYAHYRRFTAHLQHDAARGQMRTWNECKRQ